MPTCFAWQPSLFYPVSAFELVNQPVPEGEPNPGG